jgi:hypothetical protein
MLRMVGGFVVGALVALVAWGVSNSDAEAGTGPAQIRITNRQVELVKVDVGTSGRSPGDLEIVNQLLYNRRITRTSIGHAEFVCTYTIGINRNCQGTFFLPRGKLFVGGTLRYRELYQLAVLGGTGLYDNARGTLTVTRFARRPSRDIVLFRLVG